MASKVQRLVHQPSFPASSTQTLAYPLTSSLTPSLFLSLPPPLLLYLSPFLPHSFSIYLPSSSTPSLSLSLPPPLLLYLSPFLPSPFLLLRHARLSSEPCGRGVCALRGDGGGADCTDALADRQRSVALNFISSKS